MNKLRAYLNCLPSEKQKAFADRCGTTIGYLRKAISKGQSFDADLCIAIERESERAVLCEDIRPDADWGYLRGNPITNPVRACPCHEAT